jgi:aminocarboxymuconate-semialdehyde decarboxylase
MSIFIHPGDAKVGRERMKDYYLPNIVGNPLETGLAASRLVLGGILERWPALRICFSHGGGALPAIIGRLSHAWDKREDTRERSRNEPLHTARLLYYDSLTHDPQLLAYIVEHLGFERIVLGSDYPFVALGEADPVGFLERSGLPATVQANIAGNNALRFLGRL